MLYHHIHLSVAFILCSFIIVFYIFYMIVLITCSTNYRFTEVFTQLNVAEFVNLIFRDSRAVFVQGQH